jgi:FKBP-type peptidyl-prolyl cis-trans isomerase
MQCGARLHWSKTRHETLFGPAEFPMENVIPGWTEGLQLMTEGELARFWIPSELAYRNEPGKPQGTLVFDVELIKIK